MLSRFLRSTAYRDYIKPTGLLIGLFALIVVGTLLMTSLIILAHLYIAPYFIWGFPY